MTIKCIFKITTNNIKKIKQRVQVQQQRPRFLPLRVGYSSVSKVMLFLLLQALFKDLGGEGNLRRNPVQVNKHYPIEDFY